MILWTQNLKRIQCHYERRVYIRPCFANTTRERVNHEIRCNGRFCLAEWPHSFCDHSCNMLNALCCPVFFFTTKPKNTQQFVQTKPQFYFILLFIILFSSLYIKIPSTINNRPCLFAVVYKMNTELKETFHPSFPHQTIHFLSSDYLYKSKTLARCCLL